MQAAEAVYSQERAETALVGSWFADFVDETQRGLTRYISKIVASPDDVQELTQEAYLKVFCALKNSSHDNHSPKALLFMTARNIALSHLRHLRVVAQKSASVRVAEELRRDGSDTEYQASARQKFEILTKTVSALPPKCKNVILLRLENGLSQKAIGERLGISVSTVEKHLAKGLRFCSQELRQVR